MLHDDVILGIRGRVRGGSFDLTTASLFGPITGRLHSPCFGGKKAEADAGLAVSQCFPFFEEFAFLSRLFLDMHVNCMTFARYIFMYNLKRKTRNKKN